MDLRTQYKAQAQPKKAMEGNISTANEKHVPQQQQQQNQRNASPPPNGNSQKVESKLDHVSQALQNLMDVVKATSGKVDNIQTLVGSLEASSSSSSRQQNPAAVAAATADSAQPRTATSAAEDAAKKYIEERLQEKIAELEAEVRAQQAAAAETKKKQETAVRDVQAGLGSEVDQLKGQVEQERARADAMAAERAEALKRRDQAVARLEHADLRWETQFEESQAARDSIEALLKETIDREQERRRQLFEQVQDLKGSIRVMCRIRPAPAGVEPEQLVDFGPPERGQFTEEWGRLNLQATRKGATGLVTETKTFDFERVFGQGDANGAVFEEIADLVQSSMEGKKVCLFAYGQTGSGKTHTMLGSDADPGIVPQTIGMMFGVAGDAAASGSHLYSVALSVVEIYQDSVHDLLVEPVDGKKARVRLSEAAWAEVESADAALELLGQAAQHRTVASTNANDQSSRSHLILAFRITKEHLRGQRAGQRTTGTLNLVDLAGSERTAAAGATGTQMREGVSINSDLMNLNLVITALGNGTRVPYDSALTKALKDSLSRGSRTLMLVMVSPFKKDQSQTVQTLDKGAEATRAKLASLNRRGSSTPAATPARKPAAAVSALPKPKPIAGNSARTSIPRPASSSSKASTTTRRLSASSGSSRITR
ncbi:kinesin-like nuclear fusion protein [Diatrype stigma]|uniref:Kinesin-like protein n=1 Tax=Diatrype stigma TaxID=117547 RepID=A0AAN9UTS7_9PEZI